MIGIFQKKVELDKLKEWQNFQKYEKKGYVVVADFVCPKTKTRKLFNSNFIIWMDTIKASKFKDTNTIFVKPKKFDIRIKSMSLDFREKDLKNCKEN